MGILDFFKRKKRPSTPVNDNILESPSFTLEQRESEENSSLEPLLATEQTVVGYVDTGSDIIKTDGSPIADEEIAYLTELSIKETIKQELNNPKTFTPAEEELSFKFSCRHGDKLANLDKLFFQAYQNNAYQEALNALYNLKIFCLSHGKGGSIYYIENYERLHNSNNSCFSYEEIIKDKIEYQVYFNKLFEQILGLILQHPDGILQKDLYAQFHNEKTLAMRIVKDLVSKEIISKDKKGNTYLLKEIPQLRP